MFRLTRHVTRVRVLRTATRPASEATPFPSPYLSYLLCAAHRLDLLMAMRGGQGRTPFMPPFC